MEYNFKNSVKLFMVFDILGDTTRTGPLLWHIDRFRLEDVKNHVLDLLLIFRIIQKFLPDYIDSNKVFDYIICHDLPEAITGDITKFEGVSDHEIKRVTQIAIDYLSNKFDDVIDFKTILNNFEQKADLEAKIVTMIDKVHSATTFVKYQTEQNINMKNPRIIRELREHPFVVKKIDEGKDLGDIFFEFHRQAIVISEEERIKYGLNQEDADTIVEVIKSFADEFYNQKLDKTLLKNADDFPKAAMIYNRKFKQN